QMHTVTVTVLQNGLPATGVAVNFEVTSGPNQGQTNTGTTDAGGHATFTYTSNGTGGDDLITASGVINQVPFECTSQVTWNEIGCSLTPPSIIKEMGTNHTVTVTVLNNGTPVEGVNVVFAVTAGPNLGESGNGTTDAAGQATFTYLGDGGTSV